MPTDPIGPEPTEEQKPQLDRRLDEVVTWEEVMARASDRMSDRDTNSARPAEPDDELANDLIEHNPKFRALLEVSLASGREPFPFADPEE
jgi:hypothetical protein